MNYVFGRHDQLHSAPSGHVQRVDFTLTGGMLHLPHPLLADEESISKVTDAIGFRYHWDEATNQFAHASGVYVATPQGKLARYFYGIEYAPRDLRLGLIEAADNRIGSPMDQLLLYCFHYDPKTGKYGAVVMRMMQVGGVATLLAIAGMFIVMRRRNAGRGDLHAGGAV